MGEKQRAGNVRRQKKKLGSSVVVLWKLDSIGNIWKGERQAFRLLFYSEV